MSRRPDRELRTCPRGALTTKRVPRRNPIGACGDPPRDDSMTFAAIGIALTAVAWFVTPVVVAILFYAT